MTPRLIDVEELFADPEVSATTLSPDGTRLAYLSPHHGRLNVWVRGLDQEPAEGVCLTHDARRGIRTYRWSSDSRWLLYLQDTDGNEDWHLYRVDPSDPTVPALDLTPMPPGGRVMSFESDAQHPGSVVVAMNEHPVHVEAFRIDVATGATTKVLRNDDPRTSVRVSTGGRLVVDVIGDDGIWDYYVLDDDGRRRHVYRCGGTEHPLGLDPVVVGPGCLYVSGYGDGDDLQLLRVDVESGERTVAAGVPGRNLDTMGSVAPTQPPSVFVSRRTGDLLGVRLVGDRSEVLALDPHFAEVLPRLQDLDEGVLGWVSSDTAEQLWVVTFLHDRDPGRTWLYDHRTGAARLLSRSFPGLDPAELASTRSVRLQARDGLPLQAFLTLPVGLEPRGLPLVLNVHGGPWTHDQWSYAAPVQFFANRGYAVLQVNFRGSTGQGRRHLTAAVGEFAGAMHDDLVDAVGWAVAEGIADPERLAVYGGSYGGYSALIGVTVTPDLFAAAVDYVGISSLPNFMRTLPKFVEPQMKNSWYGYVGHPDDPEQEADMLRRSPITMVDRIRTPLLVVQGANDARVVQAESDNLVGALRDRGVIVEYLLAQDEGHGFQNPENNHRLYRTVERFFGEHLGGRVPPERALAR